MVLISLQVDLDTVGLKILHYTLLQEGADSTLLYLPGFQGHDTSILEQIAGWICRRSPLAVGISLMSHEYQAAAAITDFLKGRFVDLPVIWGGIHPMIAPDMCLAHADYICIGEGEAALPAFLRSLQKGAPPHQIANIWFKNAEGQIVKSRPSPPIKDVDAIARYEHIPAHSFIAHDRLIRPLNKRLFKKYGRWQGLVYSIMGSRGCPFSCAYCCNSFLSEYYDTKSIRRRSVTSIIAELEQAIRDNPDLRFINFQDDCFLACSDIYLAEFCRAYREKIGVPFIVRCIPTFVSEDRLWMLKTAGVAWVSMGIQSGSDRVLSDVYQRKALRDDCLLAARIFHKLKIAAYYDVILDNPLETEGDRLDTLLTVAQLPRPHYLLIFSLVLYPGTRLYDRLINDWPHKALEYLTKNYHAYRHDTLNDMTRMSAYLPLSMVLRLVRLYGADRNGWKFRAVLWGATRLSALIYEPLSYVRVIRLSCRGNSLQVLRMLPAYLRIGASRYIKQYSTGYTTVIEKLLRDNVSDRPSLTQSAITEDKT